MNKLFAFALPCALTLAACAPTEIETDITAKRGAALYQVNCVACHGVDARGAGTLATDLDPSPPGLRRLTINNGGTFPRDYVAATIDGLSRHSNKTAAMPEFGAGDLGPLFSLEENGRVTPIPADLLALTNYIESIQAER